MGAGALEEGLLQKSVVGMYMPGFDLDASIDNYFESPEWNDLICKWEAQVRAVVDRKGLPPQLY
ncbi:hypothetical protein V6V47_22070 [Micromonospora sp. CPCC 205539]|uniref:hypothetical protein n=1 Tax=Micromonospora sp. CPCC 205539 TaxID=3122408 RepID=UPI002FEEB307